VISLALALVLGAAPPVLAPEALRALHHGTRALCADVLQVKEGRYWARPYVSRIRLRWTPERVEWTTLSPVASTVVIDGDGLTVRGPDGLPRDLGPAAADPRFVAMLGFVRALLALDIDRIERDFVLAWGPGEVSATPRPGSPLALFTAIRLLVDERGEIASLELETATERTRLTFERVEREVGPRP